MKKIILCLSILLGATFFSNCSNDEEMVYGINEKIDNNLYTIELKSMDNLPDWLVTYIKQLENYDAPTQVDEAIFQFIWQGQIMYYHNSLYTLSPIEQVFYSDGTKVDWNKVDRADIEKNSSDLKLIYKIIRK